MSIKENNTFVSWLISLLLLCSGSAWATIPVTTDLQVYLNANDIVPTGSGTVDNWTDSNGGSITASQVGATLQPLLVSGAVNGNDVVRFDGSDRLTLSTHLFSHTADQRTVFVIFKSDGGNGHIVGTGFVLYQLFRQLWLWRGDC